MNERSMTLSGRAPGFRGEFLWELEIATRQHLALAEALPASKYTWRPDAKARSVSEVFVHVAAGIFMLLDIVGRSAPADLYGGVPSCGEEHFTGLIRRNDELEARITDKQAVLAILKRALQAAQQAFTEASEADLERRQQFFYEDTTVRR